MSKLETHIHYAVKEWYRENAPKRGLKMQTFGAQVLTDYAVKNGCVIQKENKSN